MEGLMHLLAAADTLPENNGGSTVMLGIALAVTVIGGIYLYFMLKKDR